MSAGEIAKAHFEAALREAAAAKVPEDVVARYTLGLIISTFLKNRSVADVRNELLAASENIDPETDYVFMRP